jgi:hypothetical protein
MLMIAEEGVKTILAGVCELVTSRGSRRVVHAKVARYPDRHGRTGLTCGNVREITLTAASSSSAASSLIACSLLLRPT